LPQPAAYAIGADEPGYADFPAGGVPAEDAGYMAAEASTMAQFEDSGYLDVTVEEAP